MKPLYLPSARPLFQGGIEGIQDTIVFITNLAYLVFGLLILNIAAIFFSIGTVPLNGVGLFDIVFTFYSVFRDVVCCLILSGISFHFSLTII